MGTSSAVSGCVTSGKLLHASEPLFLHLHTRLLVSLPLCLCPHKTVPSSDSFCFIFQEPFSSSKILYNLLTV